MFIVQSLKQNMYVRVLFFKSDVSGIPHLVSGFKCLHNVCNHHLKENSKKNVQLFHGYVNSQKVGQNRRSTQNHSILTEANSKLILTMRIRCPIACPGKFLWKRARTEPVLPCNRVILPQMARTRVLRAGFCGTAVRVFALNT